MPLSIAQIASKALSAVQGAITDAVHDCTLTRDDKGAYNTATGSYSNSPEYPTGRAVYSNSAASFDKFPGYTAGPNDQVIMLEGFASVKKNDRMSIGARTMTVMAVQDIGGAGSVFMVVAR